MKLLTEEECRLTELDESAGLTSAQAGQLRRLREWRQGREAAAQGRKQQLDYIQMLHRAAI